MEEKHFRAKKASMYLGVGLSTVWLYAKQGKLNPIKLSDRVTIFLKEDLDRFINNTSYLEEVDKRNSVEENTKKDNSKCINFHTIDPDKQTGDSHEC